MYNLITHNPHNNTLHIHDNDDMRPHTITCYKHTTCYQILHTIHTAHAHMHTHEKTHYTHTMHAYTHNAHTTMLLWYTWKIYSNFINILLIWFSMIISWLLTSFFSLIEIYFQQNLRVRKAVNTIASEFFRENNALFNRIQYLLKRL